MVQNVRQETHDDNIQQAATTTTTSTNILLRSVMTRDEDRKDE